jgi:hypothetical protein
MRRRFMSRRQNPLPAGRYWRRLTPCAGEPEGGEDISFVQQGLGNREMAAY